MARGFNYAPGASAEVQAAMVPGLDKEALLTLGSSRNNLVRATIASRRDCPLGLVVTLAHDYSAEVRACVARNPVAPRTVMAYLAADRSVDVLTALASNPALPPETLAELAFHKKAAVRAVATGRLNAGEQLLSPVTQEDVHTPELAEHVVPAALQATADGATAEVVTREGQGGSPFTPVNVVDIATGAPIAPSPPEPEPDYPMPANPATASGTREPAIPQIFAPHSTPDAPAPTRTAPVRGFKPKQ